MSGLKMMVPAEEHQVVTVLLTGGFPAPEEATATAAVQYPRTSAVAETLCGLYAEPEVYGQFQQARMHPGSL